MACLLLSAKPLYKTLLAYCEKAHNQWIYFNQVYKKNPTVSIQEDSFDSDVLCKIAATLSLNLNVFSDCK